MACADILALAAPVPERRLLGGESISAQFNHSAFPAALAAFS